MHCYFNRAKSQKPNAHCELTGTVDGSRARHDREWWGLGQTGWYSQQQGLLISGSTVGSEGNLGTVLSDLLIFPEKIRYFYVKLPKF